MRSTSTGTVRPRHQYRHSPTVGTSGSSGWSGITNAADHARGPSYPSGRPVRPTLDLDPRPAHVVAGPIDPPPPQADAQHGGSPWIFQIRS